MKKLIFHITLSAALFCILTAVVLMRVSDNGTAYEVGKDGGEGSTLTEGDGYKCVGEPIVITELPKMVRGGDEVFISFKGESYTEYEVRVYYPSGLSESEAFSPRKSDGDGAFGWDFTVPKNVSYGKLRIVVMSARSYLITEAEIVS